jgi:hypothetical protein
LETARHKRAIQLMQAAEQQQQQHQNMSSRQQRRRANMSATSSATNFKSNNTNQQDLMENMLDNLDAQSTVSGYKKSKAMSRNQSQMGK